MDLVRQATRQCPFLRNVAESSGQAFAEHIAVQPEQTFPGHAARQEVQGLSRCPLAGLQTAFRKFHDSEVGLVPLQARRVADVEARAFSCHCPGSCPHHEGSNRMTAPPASPRQNPCPFAAISLGGLPGPDHFLRKWIRQRKLDKQLRQQGQGGSSTSHGSSHKGPSPGRAGPARGHGIGHSGPRSACISGRPPGISAPPRNKQQKKGSSGDSRIPFWKNYGPLGGLVPLGVKGELACPPAIVAARKFVAALPPVQELRPKALHVKMATIALVAAAANIPFGAWREHFNKFSPGWFLAVHATIPFIALLRKGVVMPRWAILLTISGAIVGQTIGSRLERHRLATHAPASPRSKQLSQGVSQQQQQHAQLPQQSPIATVAMLAHDDYPSDCIDVADCNHSFRGSSAWALSTAYPAGAGSDDAKLYWTRQSQQACSVAASALSHGLQGSGACPVA